MSVQFDELKHWRIINITGIRNEDLREYMKKIQVIQEMMESRLRAERERRKLWTVEQLRASSNTFEMDISINNLWSGWWYSRFLERFKGEMRNLGTPPTMFVYHSPHAEGPISEEAEKQISGDLRKPPLFLRARPGFKIDKESPVAAAFTPEDRTCFTQTKHVSLCPWYQGSVKNVYLARQTDRATLKAAYQGQSWERYNEFLDFVEPHLPETPTVYAKRARRGSRHTADLKGIQRVLLRFCDTFKDFERSALAVNVLEKNISDKRHDEGSGRLIESFLVGAEKGLTAADLNADVRAMQSKLLSVLCVQIKGFADNMPEEFISEPEEG